MIRDVDPRSWREQAGKTLAEVAQAIGISGKNPARTYARYETGASRCPETVIAAIERLSGGAVTPTSWLRLRMRGDGLAGRGETGHV